MGRSPLPIACLLAASTLAAPSIAKAQRAEGSITLARPAEVKGLATAITALRYAPDGKTLAAGAKEPNSVFLLDAGSLAMRSTLEGHLDAIREAFYLSGGKVLVTVGDDGSARSWDAATKKERFVIDDFQGRVRSLAISPGETRIYTGEFGKRNDLSVRAWAASDGKPVGACVDYRESIMAIAASPDGKASATAGRDRTLRIWDAEELSAAKVQDLGGAMATSIAYAPDSRSMLVAFDDRTTRLLDAATFAERWRVAAKNPGFNQAVISADGKLAAISDANSFQLWRMADGVLVADGPKLPGVVTALAFSPDGRSVAVAGMPLTVSQDRKYTAIEGESTYLRAYRLGEAER